MPNAECRFLWGIGSCLSIGNRKSAITNPLGEVSDLDRSGAFDGFANVLLDPVAVGGEFALVAGFLSVHAGSQQNGVQV